MVRYAIVVAISAVACMDNQIVDPATHIWPPSNPPDLDPVFNTDYIRAPSVQVLDILFVIDDSCSMGSDQARLLGATEGLVDALIDERADIHYGVTTTTCNLSCGPVAWVASGEGVDLYQEAIRLMDVGIGGSGTEQGIQAAYEALVHSNDGFLRDRNPLHVIVVSDEADESEQGYTDWFEAVMTEELEQRGVATFSAIVQPRASSTWGCFASYSDDYIALTAKFNGEVGDICATDWTQAVRRIADSFQTWHPWFHLSRVPVAGTLTVHIETEDGIIVVPETSGWQFDQVVNAVRFSSDSEPQLFGGTAVLTYEIAQ